MEKSKFSIALLSTGLGHVQRGVEAWTDDLGKELVTHSINVTVYKGGGKRDFPHERVISCIQRASRLSNWIISHRPGFMWRFGFGSGYSLEQMTFCFSIIPSILIKQFNIIHTKDPDVALFCQRLQQIRLIRSKVILGHGTEEPFEFLKKFDYIQHLAPFHQKEALKNEVQCKKEFTIGIAIDTLRFTPGQKTDIRKELGIPDNAFVILSVAAIKKSHKRIDYLIDEVCEIANDNIYLLVAGAKEADTDELINSALNRLGKRAIFITNLQRERIWELYAIADVFVLCSLKEMLGMVILEAISSGVPAIVHKYPVEEWVVGAGGESIDMSKSGELAQTINKYLNQEYRLNKGRKAREQAVNNFSKESITQQILKMYTDVL